MQLKLTVLLLLLLQDQPEGDQQSSRLQAAGGAGHPEGGALHQRHHQLRGEGETGADAGEAQLRPRWFFRSVIICVMIQEKCDTIVCEEEGGA